MKRVIILLAAMTLLIAAFAVSQATAAGPLYVSSAPGSSDLNDCLSAATPCLTIQGAINKATAGDTINVEAGTYNEQVAIAGKDNLTLQGAGAGSTIIQSPASLAVQFTTSAGNKPVVYVNNATGVNIQNLTVDGAGLGNSNYKFEGIAFFNAGGSVQNTTITGVTETPLSGNQNGVALYAYNSDAVARSITASNNTVSTYQKSGLVFNGQNLTATVTGNTVTGAGATTLIAQNGIQLGYGAAGTVDGNTVAGNFWTGTYGGSNDPASDTNADGAAGVLLYEAGNVTVTNNTLTDNQFGVWSVGSTSIDVHGNTVASIGHSGNGYPTGVAVWTNDQWGSGEVGTTGSIVGNTFSGLDYGLQALDFTAGGPAPGVVAHSNSISGCAIDGVWSNSAFNAEGNWWGSASGPGVGSAVSANVDYSPWLEATPGTIPMIWGTNSSIQGAIDAASPGDSINVLAGTYTENVVVNKSVTLAGAGASTIVEPAVSNPNCGGGGGGSLCAGASNVILVQADNVVIHDLAVDGINPGLGGGISARNGIITNYTTGVYNSLEVYNTTVRNIYLRGMYAASGGTFNFHNNNVSNVNSDPSSIAMFAWGGPGQMVGNTVSNSNDSISANHSKGIHFLNNTVTIGTNGSGIHTDNTGDSAGSVADLIQDNNVSCTGTGAYGIFVFVPYIAPTVNHNTVTGCSIGLSAWGGDFPPGTTVTTPFTNNTVTGANETGGVGAYIATDTFYWGYTDIAVEFAGNTISGNETGVYLSADEDPVNTGSGNPYVPKTVTADFSHNAITGNTKGLDKGTGGTINATAKANWWGSASGPYNATSNAGGTGNSIADGVPFVPWLGSSDLTAPAVGYLAPTGTIHVGNPTVTATAVAGASPLTSAKVNLSAPDPANPMDFFTYTFDCTVGIGGDVSCPTTGLRLGNYTATVTVLDGANKMADSTGNFSITDTTPPVTTDNAPAAWQKTDVTVALSCVDDFSGCASTTWSADNGGPSGTGTGPIVITNEGVTTITYHSVDGVLPTGNVEGDKTATVRIDKTAPTTTDNAPAGWQMADFSVALSCGDGTLSGCASTSYTVDGGAPQSGTSVAINTTGDHTIVYHSTDVAGNAEGDHTVHAKLDKVAPSITYTGPTGTVYTLVSSITATASDADSGLQTATLSLNGAPGTACTITGGSVDCPVTLASNGVYSSVITVSDVAGNTNTASGSFDYEAHGKPDLSVAVTRIYWASYADYVANELSVDYRLNNNSVGITAMGTHIDGAISTMGVLLMTATPAPVGDIPAASSGNVTLKYSIPGGVTQFKTRLYAEAADPAGTAYLYPGPYGS